MLMLTPIKAKAQRERLAFVEAELETEIMTVREIKSELQAVRQNHKRAKKGHIKFKKKHK